MIELSDVFGIGFALAALLGMVGCASNGDMAADGAGMDDFARQWIAEMDARPAEEQVPNWTEIRAMMMRQPPRVGDPAPDFALESRDGQETIRLSQFEGKMPVVLIFGSWT